MSNNGSESSNNNKKLAMPIGLLGAFLFFVTIGSVMATGGAVRDARGFLSQINISKDSSFQKRIGEYCGTQTNYGLDVLCLDTAASFDGENTAKRVNEKALGDCVESIVVQLPTGQAFGDFKKLNRDCRFVWQQALLDLKLQSWPIGERENSSGYKAIDWLGSVVVGVFTFFKEPGGSIASSVRFSLVPLYLLTVFAVFLLFVGLGIGIRGVWGGVFISEQNRLSLSRIQVIVWTTLLLSAYSVFAAFNIGALGALVGSSPDTAQISLFPSFEGWMFVAMSITVGSPFIAYLIKGNKPVVGSEALHTKPAKTSVTAGSDAFNVALHPLSANSHPGEASLSDLFFGEDEHNAVRLDITRTQYVIITVILVFSYTGWLMIALAEISTDQMLAAFATSRPILAHFPEPGGTFTALLGMTHVTYLMGKWQPAGLIPNAPDSTKSDSVVAGAPAASDNKGEQND